MPAARPTYNEVLEPAYSTGSTQESQRVEAYLSDEVWVFEVCTFSRILRTL